MTALLSVSGRKEMAASFHSQKQAVITEGRQK
jgi:hypothetical protein